jgi:hypothetical protein
VRDKSQGKPLKHFIEDGSILEKEFGQAITDKKNRVLREASTWTSKQRDFFNGERRFIFGVANEDTAQRWINKINKAVKKFQ